MRSTCASTAARCGRTSTRTSARASPSTTPTSRARIDVIGEPVLLAGHSTGGLICSLYAHEGPHREQVRALWLNSPFFDWNLPTGGARSCTWPRPLGRFFPFLNDPKALLPRLHPGAARPGLGVRYHAQAGGGVPGLLRLARRDRRRARQGARAAWTCAARCWRCIPTKPTSCSTGATSRAGRAPSGPTSPCSRFPARCTTSRCRAPRSATRCSGSSSPGRNEPSCRRHSFRRRNVRWRTEARRCGADNGSSKEACR